MAPPTVKTNGDAKPEQSTSSAAQISTTVVKPVVQPAAVVAPVKPVGLIVNPGLTPTTDSQPRSLFTNVTGMVKESPATNLAPISQPIIQYPGGFPPQLQYVQAGPVISGLATNGQSGQYYQQPGFFPQPPAQQPVYYYYPPPNGPPGGGMGFVPSQPMMVQYCAPAPQQPQMFLQPGAVQSMQPIGLQSPQTMMYMMPAQQPQLQLPRPNPS